MSETTNNVVSLEPTTKPYEFRKLGAEDIFPMFSIINKIGIMEFKDFFEGGKLKEMTSAFFKTDAEDEEGKDATNDKDVTAFGISIFIEIANIILKNLPKCEDDIFNLLSQTSNLSVEDVRKLGLGDFAEMIIDFVKKEEFKDFFKVVSKLFK